MLTLGLRLEQHDSECPRCGDPKPSSRECVSCGLEDANVAAAGAGSIERFAAENDRARAERRARRK